MRRVGDILIRSYTDPVGDEYVEIEHFGETVLIERDNAKMLAAAIVVEATEVKAAPRRAAEVAG